MNYERARQRKLVGEYLKYLRRNKPHKLIRNTTGICDRPQERDQEIQSYEEAGINLRDGSLVKRFKLLCQAAYKRACAESPWLQELSICPEKERTGNVKRVNKAQQRFLREHFPDNSFKINKKKRPIVLYYREEHTHQMDPFAFAVIFWAVNHYIAQGYSRVFTDIKVVSRKRDQYPHFVHEIGLPHKNYLDVKGVKFERTAIGANTMHLTHGTIHDPEYGSVPILGTAVRNDNHEMAPLLDSRADGRITFVPLHLYFFRGGEGPLDLGLQNDPLEDRSDTIPHIMIAVIESIRALEEAMIKQSLS